MAITIQTDRILRLLARVILADGHIHETEIKALINSARKLKLVDLQGKLLSEQYILDWFARNLSELTSKTTEEDQEIALSSLIVHLSEWENKQSVVEVLERISLADDDFHQKEKSLISLVRSFWQHSGLDADS